MAITPTGDSPVVLERNSDLPVSLANFTMMGWIYLGTDINTFVDFLGLFDDELDFSADYIWLATQVDGITTLLEVKGTTALSTTGPTLDIATWYHLAYTKDGNTHKVYLSKEDETIDVVEIISVSKATTVTPLFLYAIADKTTRITSVKMWEATLSESEIRSERDTLSAVRTNNLHLNTPLVEHTDLTDTSGNSRDWSDVSIGGVVSTASGPAILASGSGPTAPSDITLDVTVYDQITVEWQDNSSDELGFVVERNIVSGGSSYSVIETTAPNVTSYIDTDVVAGEIYKYRVKAFNADGDSAYVTSGDTTTKEYNSLISTGVGFLKGDHPSSFDIGKVRPNWGDQTFVLWARPSDIGTVTFATWIQNFVITIDDVTDDDEVIGSFAETWDFNDEKFSFVWFGLIDGYLTLIIQDGRTLDRGRTRWVPNPVPTNPDVGQYVGPADAFQHEDISQRQIYTGPRLIVDRWTRVGFAVRTTSDDDPLSPTYLNITTTIQLYVGCEIVYTSTFPTTGMNVGNIGYGGIDQGYVGVNQKVDFFVGGMPSAADFVIEADIVPCAFYDLKQEPAPGRMADECGCLPVQPQLWWKLRDVADLNDYGYALYGGVGQETPHDAIVNGIGFATGSGVPSNPCNATNDEPGEVFAEDEELQSGTLIVQKIVLPADDETEFDFHIDGGLSPADFSLADGESETFTDVPAGTYEITEDAVAGYTTDVEVSNGSPLSAVTVAAGEIVIVTITNKKNGTLIISKVTNTGYEDLEFNISVLGGLIPSLIVLKDGQQEVYENVPANEVYQIIEEAVEGWTADILVSNGSSSNAVEIDPGGETVVMIVNTRSTGYSGIYFLHPGKRNDTLWSQING